MTLRAKLSVSVGCAVAFSIILTVFLTWDRVSHFVLSSEETHFSAVAETVENNLESSFLEYLKTKIDAVLATKNQIRSISYDARNDFLSIEQNISSPEQRKILSASLLNNHDGENIRSTSEPISLFIKKAGQLKQEGLPELGITTTSLSAKQQTIERILGTLPREGEFSLWITSEQNKQILIFLLPIDYNNFTTISKENDSNRILVSCLSLNSLFKKADALLNNRLMVAKEDFAHLKFYSNGLLMLRDENGNVLVQRGENHFSQDQLNELLKKAKHNDSAIGRLDSPAGTYFCHVSWVQTFHWYFIMAAPLDVLRATSSNLIRQLLLAGFVTLIAATVFTILIVIQAMRPLRRLRDCTNELATLDPSSSASLNDLENMLSERLNLKRRDELGDLARSFARMGHELTKNIRSSMEAMTVQKRIEGELNAAREIQMGILPVLDGQKSEANCVVAAFLEPAREVGGDLYDCFTLEDGRKAMVIGDVSGKGVPAALFMTMTLTLVRYALRSGLDPAQALANVNTLLEEHNPGNMFVTIFLAIYDPASGGVEYANAGHCQPYILNPQGQVRKLENLSGPLVGAMPELSYLLFKDELKPGEMCFLFTDGLSEAMDEKKELFGDSRLETSLQAKANVSPSALQKAIFDDICAFRGQEPPSDDITMLTFQRVA
ncbi:MAG: SpoIIE family protein phosphatase [Desulfovibrio sp.]|nr:SpoIIE family protein phosphatase [Desulfovibrio sp.]